MKFVYVFELLFVLFLLFLTLTNCTSTSNSGFYYTGDGSELLVKENELPSGWKLENSWEVPLKDGTEKRVLYIASNLPDKFIVSSAAVFDREEDAILYWDVFYKRAQTESTSSCLIPQEKYTYKSEFADQFEIFCLVSDGPVGISVYDYLIMARYGNVVSTFGGPVTDRTNLSVSQASTVGVLRWTDMETLLKLIDKKFQ